MKQLFCKYLSKHNSLASQNQKLFIKKNLQNTCGQKKDVATYLLDEVDGWLQVKTKVDEGPLDALGLVLLLFQDEHGVVEQLLQLLVGVVDAQLLKGVQLQGGIITCQSHDSHMSKATEGKLWQFFLGKSKRTWVKIKNWLSIIFCET